MNMHPPPISRKAAQTNRTGYTADPVNGPVVVAIATVVVVSGGIGVLGNH